MRFRFPSFSFSSGQPSINGAALEPVDSARAVVNDDGAILIDSEQGIMFSLNPTGGLIWAGLNEKLTKAAISQRLSQEFGVPEAQAGQDVEEFLGILEKNKLVRRALNGK